MKKIKIGDIGDVITGRTPSTLVENYWGKDFLFVTPLELHQPYKIANSAKMISFDGMNAVNLNRVGNVSVLVGCIGWDMGNVGIVDKKCAFNQQINAITNFNENFNPYFIYYLLTSKKNLFMQISSVTRTPILRKSSFENIEILVPNISIQNKIAAVLSSLDEKILLNKKINATLEEMARTFYLHNFFRKSANGTIGEIITENKKSDISVGAAKNIQGDFPFFTSGENILTWKNFLVDGRNIFLNDGGNVGVKFFVGKAAYSTHTYCISAKNNLTDYLFLFLENRQSEIERRFFTGTGLKNLRKDLLKNFAIYIPTAAELENFNKFVCPLFDMISKNFRESTRLENLRDFLLPLLMNGQVGFKT